MSEMDIIKNFQKFVISIILAINAIFLVFHIAEMINLPIEIWAVLTISFSMSLVYFVFDIINFFHHRDHRRYFEEEARKKAKEEARRWNTYLEMVKHEILSQNPFK